MTVDRLALALQPQRIRMLLKDLGWDGTLGLLEEEARRRGDSKLADLLNAVAVYAVAVYAVFDSGLADSPLNKPGDHRDRGLGFIGAKKRPSFRVPGPVTTRASAERL